MSVSILTRGRLRGSRTLLVLRKCTTQWFFPDWTSEPDFGLYVLIILTTIASRPVVVAHRPWLYRRSLCPADVVYATSRSRRTRRRASRSEGEGRRGCGQDRVSVSDKLDPVVEGWSRRSSGRSYQCPIYPGPKNPNVPGRGTPVRLLQCEDLGVTTGLVRGTDESRTVPRGVP